MNLKNLYSHKEFIFTGRVLLQASRSPQTYFLRGGVLAFLMLIFQPFIESSLLTGMMLFNALIVMNFFYLSFYSCIVFGSMISSEKESGTLGLLMITPRKPLSLISAKSLPIFLEIINSILLQLPVFIICITLGGVDGKQIPQVALLIAFHILLLGSIGIFYSSWCKNSKQAVNYTIFTALTFFFGPMVIDRIQAAYFSNTTPLSLMSKFEPLNNLMTLEKIMSFNNKLENILISGCVAIIIFIISIFFSTKILEKTSLNTTVDSGKNKHTAKTHKRAWKEAMLGKDFQLFGGRKFQLFKIIGYLIMAVALYRYFVVNTRFQPSQALEVICILFIGAFMVEILAYSSQAFLIETKNKQMSSILLLPTSNAVILINKFKSVLLSSLAPLVFGLILMVVNPDFMNEFMEITTEPITYALLSIYLIVMLYIINGALVKSIKQNFKQKSINFICAILFYIFVAKPLLESYDRKPTLVSITVIVSALFYSYYMLKKILKNMSLVAQQEN